ncbi:stage II sporulation protein E [Natranaerovirga pectinivora]|uniref:Stage II sporulation protein E n=1 Tax=Natranaerovirga pectinivora TaxID=682400 RepID=A0A4R3MPH1_9FIRM|nr:SpoIIE family protein phosphatase [Natranaerovirga pectinivora]TCT16171.1 stage II sporulation protein E [Natranaerovirga pectinivora]
MKYYIDVSYNSINKWGEELCGDHIEIVKSDDGVIIVLADGLGSGVKANILATLTSKIAVTMLKEGASLEETIDTISNTLPECQVRRLAYSTFTIIKVQNDGGVYIAECDNPPFFIFDNGRDRKIYKEKKTLNGKVIYESQFRMDQDGLLTVVSDGAVHAGVGKLLNLGWQWENINDFLREIAKKEKCSKNVSRHLINACENLYDNKPGDDTTVVSIKLRQPEVVNLFTGPPESMEDDIKLVNYLKHSAGKIVVSGGTTANIVSRILNRALIVDMDTYAEDVPPMARIEGVDLVTEGVLTMKKTLEIIKETLLINDHLIYQKLLNENNGASKLAKILLEDCTHLHIWLGRAVNPAHQNPKFPIDFNIKVNIVKELQDILNFLGKEVEVTYI